MINRERKVKLKVNPSGESLKLPQQKSIKKAKKNAYRNGFFLIIKLSDKALAFIKAILLKAKKSPVLSINKKIALKTEIEIKRLKRKVIRK